MILLILLLPLVLFCVISLCYLCGTCKCYCVVFPPSCSPLWLMISFLLLVYINTFIKTHGISVLSGLRALVQLTAKKMNTVRCLKCIISIGFLYVCQPKSVVLKCLQVDCLRFPALSQFCLQATRLLICFFPALWTSAWEHQLLSLAPRTLGFHCGSFDFGLLSAPFGFVCFMFELRPCFGLLPSSSHIFLCMFFLLNSIKWVCSLGCLAFGSQSLVFLCLHLT